MLVTQTFDKKLYEASVQKHLRTAAFREWQHRLTRTDRLPRGKFFRGKCAGRPMLIMDEAHFINESYAVLNSEARRAGLRIDISRMQTSVDNKV